MKTFKFLMVIAFGLSGYIGYNNFLSKEVIKKTVEHYEQGKERDWVEVGLRVGEMIAPLIPVYLARKKKETMDADVKRATNTVVRGKLGLFDRRKAPRNETKNRRRSYDP